MRAASSEHPARRELWLFGRVFVAAAVAVGLLGVFRLTRQFPSAASSPSLLVPFLLPILAFALEAGALVALSASLLDVYRRLPARPFLRRLRVAGVAALPFVLIVVAALALPRGSERPGAFANELIASARSSCSGAERVSVPLLGLTVHCERGGLLEGAMPSVPRVQLSMQTLTFSEDLKWVTIGGLDLSARQWLSVRLRAKSARIVGLSPWSRSPRLTPGLRFGMLLTLGISFGVLAGWLIRSQETPSETSGLGPPTASSPPRPSAWRRGLSLVIAGAPGLAAAFVIISLDQEQAGPYVYAWAWVAAFALMGLLAIGQRVAPRMFSSFGAL